MSSTISTLVALSILSEKFLSTLLEEINLIVGLVSCVASGEIAQVCGRGSFFRILMEFLSSRLLYLTVLVLEGRDLGFFGVG